jgi:hypothetical protein
MPAFGDRAFKNHHSYTAKEFEASKAMASLATVEPRRSRKKHFRLLKNLRNGGEPHVV